MRDLRTLPKAHLHIHLEAAMRPTTYTDMARALGIDAPPIGRFRDFTEFVAEYLGLLTVLTTPANITRLIDEAVEDAANDGAVAIELATTPDWYADIYGSRDHALDAITTAARDAGERHGVWVGIIVAIQRDLDQDHATTTADLATRFADAGVTGLGLHSEERGHPARNFTRQFATACDAGLASIPHAGELVGPESVWEAIDLLGAHRIQHGVTSVHDPSLLTALAERRITLDVCPTSNLALGVVDDLATHPIKALLDAGVRCSINADDPTLFGPGLLDEYQTCRDTIGLTDHQLATCAAASIDASGAPGPLKTEALRDLDAWISSPT